MKGSGALIGTLPVQEPSSTPDSVCSAVQECFPKRASKSSQEKQEIKNQVRVSQDGSDVQVRASQVDSDVQVRESSVCSGSDVPVRESSVCSDSDVPVPSSLSAVMSNVVSVPPDHPVKSSVPLQSGSVQVGRPVQDETPVLPEEVEDEPLMYVAGFVNGHKIDVLVDCGATASYINHEVVKRFRIPTSKKKEPTTVAFGNGQPTPCTQYCHIRLKLAENYQPVIQFNVVHMKFEAILGKRWLARADPQPVVDLAKYTIRVGNDVCIQGYPEPSHKPVLSAMHSSAACKRIRLIFALCAQVIVHPRFQNHLRVPRSKICCPSIKMYSPMSCLRNYLRKGPLITRSRSFLALLLRLDLRINCR